MKVVVAKTEGYAHLGLLDDLDLPDVQIVRVETPEDLTREIGDAEVFYGFVDSDLLREARALRWIQSPSAGVNFLQHLPELVENDIVLTNTRGAHGPSIGEHTFALLFALTRRLPDCVTAQHERRWAWGDLYRTCREIRGMTMGIIGYGAIGRAVAALQAIGAP